MAQYLPFLRKLKRIKRNDKKFFLQVETRQFVREEILTKPYAVYGVTIEDVTTESCTISWQIYDGQACLKGFIVQVRKLGTF